MRLIGFAAVAAASMLSTSVSAAAITYTISGLFSQKLSYGVDGDALAQAFGTPSSFLATFTLDSETSDENPSAGLGVYKASAAAVTLDGGSFISKSDPYFSGRMVITDNYYGMTSFYFAIDAVRDAAPNVPGLENTHFVFEALVPGGSVSSSSLPQDGSALTFISRSASASLIGLNTEGGQSSTYLDPITFSVSVSPTPEPGEWAMIAGGLGIVGGAARRRRKG